LGELVTLWDSKESHLFLNPRFSSERKARLLNAFERQRREETIWLKSSGTESSGFGDKLVALNKKAILEGAKAANDFFQVTAKDRWLNPLPEFHIGGLALSARCHLSGAVSLSFGDWSVEKFMSQIKAEQATITSLVPTQVFDLVSQKQPPPPCLRFVLVGGGALSESLYTQARALGWPLLPSYGMTETSAVVASADLQSLSSQKRPLMKALPHVQLKPVDGQYEIQSPALFDGYLWVQDNGDSRWEPRPENFILDDRIEIKSGGIRVLGRDSELVKILGETVNLASLNEKLSERLGVATALSPPRRRSSGF
jgi:O-succinylbenzoic acid--CoA ligase